MTRAARTKQCGLRDGADLDGAVSGRFAPRPPGLKRKDLVGLPWQVALALRDDGWWLRQDIIWSKRAPTPESVRDRCTRSHEYVFLLTKSRRYYFDYQAIREPSTWEGQRRNRIDPVATAMPSAPPHRGLRARDAHPPEVRSKRSVWTIAPKPFRGAHFAVMPPALVEPCVLAGSQPGDIVIDPFSGAGTVGLVARRLGRSFIGTELSPEYAKLTVERWAKG